MYTNNNETCFPGDDWGLFSKEIRVEELPDSYQASQYEDQQDDPFKVSYNK